MSHQVPSQEDRLAAIEKFNLGVKSAQEGDEAAAAELWREALSFDPGFTPAIRNLVVYHGQRDDHEQVVELYARMLATDPFDTDALVRQGAALRKLGRHDEAIDNYERAIRIYPYFRFWYSELAEILDEAGRPDDAEAWREKGRALDADDAEFAFEDGIRNYKAGKLDLAAACFQAVLEDYPANLDARLRLARVYQKNKQYDEALSAYAAALEINRDASPLVRFRRASLYARLGRARDAIHDLQAALREEPAYGRARALLAELGVDPKRVPLSVSAVGQQASPQVIDSTRSTLDGEKGLETKQLSVNPEPSHASGDAPMLDATDLEMESIGIDDEVEPIPMSSGDQPVLTAPNPHLTWEQQLEHIFRQALRLRSPGGGPPRVALLCEPLYELATATEHVITTLKSDELWPENPPPAGKRAFLVEAESQSGSGMLGIAGEGWLSHDGEPPIDPASWRLPRSGVPVDQLLAAAGRIGGVNGFNVVIIVSSGRIRSDQTDTRERLKELPCHQVVWLRPQYHYVDLRVRLQRAAPNWVEIALPY